MPPPSGGEPKLPLELYLPLIAPPETGSCCRMSPTEARPVRSRSSRDIVSTGACLPSGSPMREPVITMTSPSVGGVGSAETGPAVTSGVGGGGAGGLSVGAGCGAGASAGAGSAGGAGVGVGAWATRAARRIRSVLCPYAVPAIRSTARPAHTRLPDQLGSFICPPREPLLLCGPRRWKPLHAGFAKPGCHYRHLLAQVRGSASRATGRPVI